MQRNRQISMPLRFFGLAIALAVAPILVDVPAGATTPNAPTGVTVAFSGSQALVSWTAPTPVTGVTITGYTVTSSPASLGCTVASPGLSCAVPALTSSTSYTFFVSASSSGGSGSSASSSSSTSPAPTSSAISLSALPASPENLNARITLTAEVTTGATGTVNFKNGGTTISGCQFRPVNSGYASCITSSLASGTNSITAVYSGDSNYSGSTSSPLSYLISGTTLSAVTTPLIITSTAAPINTPINLVVTGGNGTGSITFTVANGTATGCSVSSDTLSVPSNVSGTCLVTASQVSTSTSLGDSSSVTAVNFFWNYATYPYSYPYCAGGDTLSGDTCTHLTYVGPASEEEAYYCPSGWSGPIDGGYECYRYAAITHSACTADGGTWTGSECELFTGSDYGTDGGAFGYVCSPLYDTLIGTSCYSASTYTAYEGIAYSCPYGGTESGLTCSLSGGSGPNLRISGRLPSAATLSSRRGSSLAATRFLKIGKSLTSRKVPS
jgi:hypothetical protein